MPVAVSSNPFGHVDVRVRDLSQALVFYQQLLPALGFTKSFQGDAWCVFGTDGQIPEAPYFAFTEDKMHSPSPHRLAFWVHERGEVDRVAEVARQAGASRVDGPMATPYSSGHYAVFIDDPCGNRLEVYHRVD
ncbi:MAG TPA: VOC family protein [Candidatus Synoicihabitans sp.]|nr:VOC family protein [Candidatus Synoicihabitans sp.]